MIQPANEPIASKLREMADLLEQQQANSYWISAYRRAAQTMEDLARPIEEIVRGAGLVGVIELPGIGRGIGVAIVEMITTGRWAQLERLAGTLEPEQLFRTIPGIGPELATRIHDELHVDSLEQLEDAAHDGRLVHVPGIGQRRAAAIRAALSERLGYRRIRSRQQSQLPSVELLLDVDREYRRKAAAGELRRIAPRGSIQRARPGCLCCIPSAAAGSSPHFSPTHRTRTTCTRPATGW